MQRKTSTRAKEAALLRDVRRWMGATADQLDALMQQSRALRRKMARTERYRRVDGKDVAEKEPMWDVAATLEVNLEESLEEAVEYLRRDARGRRGRGPQDFSPN